MSCHYFKLLNDMRLKPSDINSVPLDQPSLPLSICPFVKTAQIVDIPKSVTTLRAPCLPVFSTRWYTFARRVLEIFAVLLLLQYRELRS